MSGCRGACRKISLLIAYVVYVCLVCTWHSTPSHPSTASHSNMHQTSIVPDKPKARPKPIPAAKKARAAPIKPSSHHPISPSSSVALGNKRKLDPTPGKSVDKRQKSSSSRSPELSDPKAKSKPYQRNPAGNGPNARPSQSTSECQPRRKSNLSQSSRRSSSPVPVDPTTPSFSQSSALLSDPEPEPEQDEVDLGDLEIEAFIIRDGYGMLPIR